MTRIYVPATVTMLAEWYAAGVLPGTDEGYLAPDESEEAEYDALMSAADASANLLSGVGRRVVIVVDADPDAAGPVPFRQVVAVHADLDERPAHADPDEDLGWFATQEIPDLID